MTSSQTEFTLGDPVVFIETNEKAVISRLCPDPDTIYIRWDTSHQQEMVKTKNLRRDK